mgnify:CR=1 FL=1
MNNSKTIPSRFFGYAVLLNTLEILGSMLSLMPAAMILWVLYTTDRTFGRHYTVQSYSFLMIGLVFWVCFGVLIYRILRRLENKDSDHVLERERNRLLDTRQDWSFLWNKAYLLILVVTIIILAIAAQRLIGDARRGFLVSVFTFNTTALLYVPASIKLTFNALHSIQQSHPERLESVLTKQRKTNFGYLAVALVAALLVVVSKLVW